MHIEKSHILVVDDDTRLRSLLQRYLRESDFVVSIAKDAADAREMLKFYEFDLLIVDIMMPNETGLEFLKSIRKDNAVPVILLTAMGETSDRIGGLELGADDYMAKPFEPKELLLRINNIIKRKSGEKTVSQNKLNFGTCSFDVAKKELIGENGKIIHITPVEQSLLLILGQKLAQVFSREKLAEMLGAGQSPRSIDVQIARLRRKVEGDSKNPRYLQTVRGKGYMLISD
ncbi:MAG: response regulator [Alphaproteobacteria bacterium]